VIIPDLLGGSKPLLGKFQKPGQIPRLAGNFQSGRVVHQKVQAEDDEAVVVERSWQFQELTDNKKWRRKKVMTVIIKSYRRLAEIARNSAPIQQLTLSSLDRLPVKMLTERQTYNRYCRPRINETPEPRGRLASEHRVQERSRDRDLPSSANRQFAKLEAEGKSGSL